MKSAFKNFLLIIGGIAIGFGIGMVVATYLTFGEIGYWMAVIISLILGGFLMAIGITFKNAKKIVETVDDEELNNEQPEEHEEQEKQKQLEQPEE